MNRKKGGSLFFIWWKYKSGLNFDQFCCSSSEKWTSAMFHLLFFCFLIGYCSAGCPNGAIEWQSECYHFRSNLTAFINAEQDCIGFGGHLASIHNGFTNAFLARKFQDIRGSLEFFWIHCFADLLKTGFFLEQSTLHFTDSSVSDFWLGGSTLIKPGTWSWTDGSFFDFTELPNGQNASGEACLSLSMSNGYWNTVDCFKPKPYVCRVSEIPDPPPFYNCSLGWIYFEPTHSCYGISRFAEWKETELDCRNRGGNLTSIHSDEETYFAYSKFFCPKLSPRKSSVHGKTKFGTPVS